jgi:hypothetical protein
MHANWTYEDKANIIIENNGIQHQDAKEKISNLNIQIRNIKGAIPLFDPRDVSAGLLLVSDALQFSSFSSSFYEILLQMICLGRGKQIHMMKNKFR